MKSLENIRVGGLSEAFFFSFNLADDKSKRLVSHGVIFTSVIKPGEEKLDLLTQESDSRVKDLVDYIYANFFKDKFEDLQKRVSKLNSFYPEAKKAIELIEEMLKKQDYGKAN